jgi:hypothetical protein
MQLASSAREHIINLPHDPLGPLDARFNQLICSWTSLWSTEQVVRRLHVQARKNCCHDSEHALSTFVHGASHQTVMRVEPQATLREVDRSIALVSLFVRYDE